MTGSPLRAPDRAWFRRDSLELARDLLGAVLVRSTPEGTVAIRITEVEAYRGAEDPASHAYRGPTARNAAMFGDAGLLYVYRHLGLHHCANLVAGEVGTGQAVLLRAGEVTEGVGLARARRTAAGVCRTDRDLARGPARLAVAAALTRADDGLDVVGDGARGGGARDRGRETVGATEVAGGRGPAADDGARVVRLLVGDRLSDVRVATGPRVGVAGAGEWAAALPYRFWVAGDPHVSAYRA